jgi:CelD/BcsL family acetyltransferase involved in cellulose biosynthesis
MSSKLFHFEAFDSIQKPELKRAWQDLEKRGVCTPHQSYTYASAIEAHMVDRQKDRPYHVLIRSRSDDRPVLILPMTVTEHLGLKRLDFLDFWVADHHVPVFDPMAFDTPAKRQALRDALNEGLTEFDIVRSRLLVDSWDGFENPLSEWFSVTHAEEGSYFLDLRDTSLTEVQKGKSAYKQSRRGRRRLSDTFGIEMTHPRTESDVRRAFDAMVRQRRAKFEPLGINDGFSEPAIQGFFTERCVKALENRSALLTTFEMEGRCVATSLCIIERDIMVGHAFSAEDGPWMKYGPGKIALLHEIETAFEMGLSGYDFGAGAEDYKRSFGGDFVPHRAARAPLSQYGQAYHALSALKQKARDSKTQITSLADYVPQLSRGTG